MRNWVAIAVGLALTLVCGWALWRGYSVSEPTVEAVEVVGPGALGACQEVSPIGDACWWLAEFESSHLVISVSTSTDLTERAHRFEMNTWVDADACDRQLPIFALGPVRGTNTELSGRFSYQVFVSVRAAEGHFDRAYDLVERPTDICFRLRGGNMLGGRFVSQWIRVDKSAVERALISERGPPASPRLD